MLRVDLCVDVMLCVMCVYLCVNVFGAVCVSVCGRFLLFCVFLLSVNVSYLSINRITK